MDVNEADQVITGPRGHGGAGHRWRSGRGGWTSNTRGMRASSTSSGADRPTARLTQVQACGIRCAGPHLVGPVLAALRTWDPVMDLTVVGSYQGSSAAVHALAREAAESDLARSSVSSPPCFFP